MAGTQRDEISGQETTGHDWDGIKELNTPLPRWWLWTFYATVIWGVAYCIFYPAVPLINDATKGVLGYSSRAELADEMAAAKAAQAKSLDQIKALALGKINATPALRQFAVAGGKSAFAVNCSQCHGLGAAGGKGYPNLNDDDWLWGGSLDHIYKTIAHGIRFDGDDATRISEMPSFGRDDLLNGEKIDQVAEYVLQLAGRKHDGTKAAAGKPVYAENCAACHGARGEGKREFGAPRLNDAIWLYGGSKTAIVGIVTNARNAVMPGWRRKLDDATIKKLAIYVHSLGGGE
jgi:cytochrome c oxidase cbb3-type subunit 3